tara:strand:- start:363 stop:563 length:201 start_codon:yes stop_codon:yes gene_type:complete
MNRLFKYVLSVVMLFGALPTIQAMDMSETVSEQVKRGKKKKKKVLIEKIKKRKKGFYSSAFGNSRP